jgi:glycosyltransferase involved in cell wall biosynthesis
MTKVEQTIPRVSIGMPVHNGEQQLRQAIESLLAQTFEDFELIISDNASTDKTQMICEEYVIKDSRIRYIRQDHNQGAVENFKTVLRHSRSIYFMWAAHDDTWENNFIKFIYDHLESNKDVGLAFCWYNLVDVNSHKTIKTLQPNTNLHNNKAYNYLINLLSVSVHKVYGIYRKEILCQAINVYHMSDFFDVFLTSYFSVKSKISIIPSVLFNYGEDVHKLRNTVSSKKVFRFDYLTYYTSNCKLLFYADFGLISKLICLFVFNMHFVKLIINGKFF